MLGWELPPHNSGGLGVACLQLSKSLSKLGAKIDFVVPYVGNEQFDFMNVIYAKLAHPAVISGVYDSATFYEGSSTLGKDIYSVEANYQKAIEKIVIETDFDIIHAHDWLTFRAALRARELSGKPLILHVHSIESDRAGGKHGNPLVHEIERMGLSIADRIVAVSELTKQKIVHEYGIPADKIVVAHNSLDLDFMEDLQGDNEYRLLSKLKQEGYRVVTNIGRLTIQKGLGGFLRAAQLVVEKQPKTIFLIIGSGDQKRELIELAASLGIARNVIFVDFQRGKRWRDAFAISDLFVMPSISEPFGLTPLEAAYYDTPSLISRQSGIAEVLQSCLKVDFWDIHKMADQIISFVSYDGLQSSLKYDLNRELSKLSWDKTAKTLLSTYKEHHQAVAI